MNEKPEIIRSCQTCRFSVLEQVDPKVIQRVLVCHFNPPSISYLVTRDGGMAGVTGFPQVNPKQWCYQWRAQSAINDPAAGTGDGSSQVPG